MAKKKQAKAKKEAPSKRESNSMGWIIAAIVVVVIIAFVALKNSKPVIVAEEPIVKEAEKGIVNTSPTPEMDKKCTLAIGAVPGTRSVQGDVVSITFKNNGKVAVEGAYFEFSDGEGNVAYKKNTDTIQPLGKLEYKIDLGQASIEAGIAISKFVIYPVQNGKACENQRNVVIDYK